MPITIDFMGDLVGIPTGDWAGETGMVSGSYSYDSDLNLSVSSGTSEKYQAIDPNNAPLASSWGFSITLGSTTKTYAGWYHLFLVEGSYDAYTFSAAENAARIRLVDYTGTALALAGSAPTEAPNLDE